MTDRPHTTKALNRMLSQPNTHASPRHKRGPGHRPAQTHLPQVCETCVGTLRQTHRSHKARPTHTSPSGTGTPSCQATWDMGHHSQPSQRTTPLSHQGAHRSHCQPGKGGKAPPHRLPAGWPPAGVEVGDTSCLPRAPLFQNTLSLPGSLATLSPFLATVLVSD